MYNRYVNKSKLQCSETSLSLYVRFASCLLLHLFGCSILQNQASVSLLHKHRFQVKITAKASKLSRGRSCTEWMSVFDIRNLSSPAEGRDFVCKKGLQILIFLDNIIVHMIYDIYYMSITKGLAPCEFRLISGTRDTPSNLITCLV